MTPLGGGSGGGGGGGGSNYPLSKHLLSFDDTRESSEIVISQEDYDTGYPYLFVVLRRDKGAAAKYVNVTIHLSLLRLDVAGVTRINSDINAYLMKSTRTIQFTAGTHVVEASLRWA